VLPEGISSGRAGGGWAVLEPSQPDSALRGTIPKELAPGPRVDLNSMSWPSKGRRCREGGVERAELGAEVLGQNPGRRARRVRSRADSLWHTSRRGGSSAREPANLSRRGYGV